MSNASYIFTTGGTTGGVSLWELLLYLEPLSQHVTWRGGAETKHVDNRILSGDELDQLQGAIGHCIATMGAGNVVL